jgi:hypothetical protein
VGFSSVYLHPVSRRVATSVLGSIRQRLEYLHLNPVRKGLVARPEDWRWSSYDNFDRWKRAVCPIQVDFIWLPEGYRA